VVRKQSSTILVSQLQSGVLINNLIGPDSHGALRTTVIPGSCVGGACALRDLSFARQRSARSPPSPVYMTFANPETLAISHVCQRCGHVCHISCWQQQTWTTCPTGCGCNCASSRVASVPMSDAARSVRSVAL
jgi:hypothetical protein